VSLRAELEPFASSGHEAFQIIERWFNGIVAALRRDSRFADVRPQALELLLADKRAEIEHELFNALRDRVHLDHIDYVNADGE
jgi:hypothetical protein